MSSTGGDFLDEFLGDGPFFGGEGDGDEGEALGGECVSSGVVLFVDLPHRLGGGAVELEFDEVVVARGLDGHVDASVAGLDLGVDRHSDGLEDDIDDGLPVSGVLSPDAGQSM